MRSLQIFLILTFFFRQLNAQIQADPKLFILDQGAITRGDSTRKRIAFVFTGDEYYEGLKSISQSLAREKIKGSFFFTGRLYRKSKARKSIVQLATAGHYMGPHADMHLLYNDWSKRDSLLVTKDSLVNDLKANVRRQANVDFWL